MSNLNKRAGPDVSNKKYRTVATTEYFASQTWSFYNNFHRQKSEPAAWEGKLGGELTNTQLRPHDPQPRKLIGPPPECDNELHIMYIPNT